MIIVCPCCAARFSIEAALTDADARQAVATALKLPAPLGDLLLRYIGLFRPAKRSLSWDRAAKLLNELLAAIEAGRVERNGRTWVAPIDYWRLALEEMIARRDKLTLPMQSHGYLFDIIAGMASKSEGRAERAAEDEKRYATRSGSQGGPASVAQVLDRARGAELTAQLREAIKK